MRAVGYSTKTPRQELPKIVVLAYLDSAPPALYSGNLERSPSAESEAIATAKREAARTQLQVVRERWQVIMARMDHPGREEDALLDAAARGRLRPEDIIFYLLQRRDLRISYRR